MKTLLILAALVVFQDTPSAPVGGKITWRRDVSVAMKRARLEQRASLLYFTDGGLACRALDAGPFSDGAVVTVAGKLIPVLLECPDEKANAEIRKLHAVTGFPTLLILDPDGKPLGEVTAREAAAIAAELDKASKRFPGRPVLWHSSVDEGVARAKEEKKPVAVYFHDDKEDLADAQDRLSKLAGSRVDKFVWVEIPSTNEDTDANKTTYQYISLPAVAFLDPRPDKPKRFGIYEITSKAKAKDVQDKLESMLKKYRDAKVK
ncbi:MAG TPA: hypothetical protein VK661_03265 [Planctomycetota bacterium]|nr:hypothetical protein [Planctomycetota bacterium]